MPTPTEIMTDHPLGTSMWIPNMDQWSFYLLTIHPTLESPNIFRGFEIEGMGFWSSSLVLLPHLDGLVRFTRHKPWTSNIIGESIYSSFTVQGSWKESQNIMCAVLAYHDYRGKHLLIMNHTRLHNSLGLLEVVATHPIPKPQAPIVTFKENIFK